MSNKKQEVKTQNRSGKGKYIISCITISLGLIFVIPFVINWLFSLSAPCELFEAKWFEADALSYGGAVLSFIGTVVLGAITVYQTREAHKQTEKANNQTEKANQLAQDALIQTEKANVLAAQMQKLEQARFVSMVSLMNVAFSEIDDGESFPYGQKIASPISEKINLAKPSANANRYFVFQLDLYNASEFPIVQMCITPSFGIEENSTDFGIVSSSTKTVYLPPNRATGVQISIPSEYLKKNKISKMLLDIDFVNVFDSITPSALHLDNLGVINRRFQYKYRLAKFINVIPPQSEEDADDII